MRIGLMFALAIAATIWIFVAFPPVCHGEGAFRIAGVLQHGCGPVTGSR